MIRRRGLSDLIGLWVLATLSASLLAIPNVSLSQDNPREVVHRQTTDVVVLGGGLSGLLVGYRLSQDQQNFLLLEGSEKLGGRVSTLRYPVGRDIVTANEGVEEFWQGNPFIEIAKSLKLPMNIENAFSSVMLNGKLHIYQRGESKMQFLSRIMSEYELNELRRIESVIQQIFDQGLSRNRPLTLPFFKYKTLSFEQWVEQQRVPKVVADWVRICIEPEMATEWNRVSAVEGFFEYQKFLGQKGVLNYQISTGTQSLTDKMAEEIGKQRIQTQSVVEEITDHGDKVTVRYRNARGELCEIVARHVVTTIPIKTLKAQVQMIPPPLLQQDMAIRTQEQGHYLKLHILLKPGAEAYWERDGRSILPVLTDSSLGVIYEGNPDKSGQVKSQVLTILLHGRHVTSLEGLTDEQIKTQTLERLERFFPGIGKEVISTHVLSRLTPVSIAAWPVGRARNDHLSTSLKITEGRVTFAGDFTESTHSEGAAFSASRALQDVYRSFGFGNCQSLFMSQ